MKRAIKDIAGSTISLMRGDQAFYLAIVLYTICGLMLLDLVGAASQAAYSVYLTRWALLFMFLLPSVALLVDATLVLHRFDRRRKLAFSRAFNPNRMAHMLAGVALLMAMMLFQGTFTSIKNALPIMRGGFPQDRGQADIDAALHGGVDPWRWLFAVGESDLVRGVVEWNYNFLWFVLVFGALFYVVTSPRTREIRARYLTAFMLCWIVCGNVLAGLFLSAGPAFYGAVTGDEARFAEQITFLAQSASSAHSAAAYQDYLWSLYSAGQAGFGSGISAFPSVHVGLVAVNALFLAEFSRRLAIAAFVYLAFIMASSVYLAWHYAIDGYASVVAVTAIHLLLRRAFAPGRSYLTTRFQPKAA